MTLAGIYAVINEKIIHEHLKPYWASELENFQENNEEKTTAVLWYTICYITLIPFPGIQPAMVNSESYVPPSVDWRDWEGMTGIQEEVSATEPCRFCNHSTTLIFCTLRS